MARSIASRSMRRTSPRAARWTRARGTARSLAPEPTGRTEWPRPAASELQVARFPRALPVQLHADGVETQPVCHREYGAPAAERIDDGSGGGVREHVFASELASRDAHGLSPGHLARRR